MKNSYSRNILKNLILILVLLLASLLFELLFFNFKTLFISKDNRSIIIKNYEKKVYDDKTIIEFNLNNKYVNKMKILYSTKSDIDVNIEYQTRDYYNKIFKKNKIDRLDNEMTLQAFSVNNRVKRVKIFYSSTSVLTIKKIFVDNRVNINIFRVFFVFAFLVMLFLVKKMYDNKGKNVYKYHFIIGLLLGITMIILQPSTTFYSWDDQIHFKNAYELLGSNFDWSIGEYQMVNDKLVGRDNIDSIDEQINQARFLNTNASSKLSTKSGRLIQYNRVAYIPFAIGYHVCKILKFPFTICFKFGKILNLIVFMLIMSYAIKISRIGKNILIVIGLLPSTIFLASQYSYDSAVISGTILSLVVLINWFVDQSYKVDFKSIATFLFGILFSCFTKGVYIPFILLFLFIPHNKFNNRKIEIKSKIIISIIFLLVMATFALPSNFSTDSGGDTRGGAVNTAEQMKLIISKPFGYVSVLRDSGINQFFDKTIGVGTLGSFAYIGEINKNVYYVLLFVLIFVSLANNSNANIDKIRKILLISITLAIWVLIWTALYLSFTPVGFNIIDGVQSRYFIPLLFPLLICLCPYSIKCNIADKKMYSIIFILMILCEMYSIYELILMRYCL